MTPSRSTGGIPDINEAGRVMAQLNDWRAIVFVLVFIIIAFIIERFWMQREMRLERQQLREVATIFGNSAEKVSEALNSLKTEITVLRAVSSRVEATHPEK